MSAGGGPGMLRPVLSLGLNELRLTWKDRTSLMWMVLMPILFILFFGYVSSGGRPGGTDRSIRLSVVDRDVSWLSRAVIEALAAEDFEVVELDEEAVKTTDDRVRTLVIPAGFADAVARKQQVTLFLTSRPSASDRATSLAEIHIHRALVQVLAALVDMNEIAPPAEPLLEQGERLGEIRRRLARPSLVKVEATYAGKGRVVPNGFGQAVPGMLTQFMIMSVFIGGGTSLTTEKVSGTLRRLASAPFTPRSLIAGKLAGLFLIGIAQSVVLLIVGGVISAIGLFGTDFYWGNSPLGLALVIIAASLVSASVGLFLGAILSTPAQASAVGWLAGTLMSGLGGCWWPLEIVPPWLRQAGHIFPTAWTMDALHDLTSFGRGLDAVLPEVAILLATAAVFGYAGARLLRVQ